MNYATSLSTLNTRIGDTGNVTFTPEEKQNALTQAWNDAYVCNTVWNSSLTFTSTVFNYTLPATITTVKDVYLSRSNSSSDFPEKISADLWEVVAGVLHFKPPAQGLPTGYTLYLKGNYKLNPDTDTLDNVNLQQYVIALAGVNTLTLLGFKKANLFLKNDLTMSELITLRREFERDVAVYRQRLLKEYETA